MAVLFPPSILPALASEDHALFATSDQNPFIQIYSLPSPAEFPRPAARGWTWQFIFDLASNAISEDAPNGERITLDGETYRTSVVLGYGLSDRFTAAVNLPWWRTAAASWTDSCATGTARLASPTRAVMRSRTISWTTSTPGRTVKASRSKSAAAASAISA
jgi:hypothetical protein